MRWASGLTWLVALLGNGKGPPILLQAVLIDILSTTATCAIGADTTVVHDPQTGFTFTQYSAEYAIGAYIQFRVAIPSPAVAPYDLVVQIIAPNNVGWTGIAWAGTMIDSPLTVGWASSGSVGDAVLHSPTYSQPALWTGATLTPLRIGTQANGTGWQLTAKCSGCSYFMNENNAYTTLSSSGTNRLAFAYSASGPSGSSSSAASSLPVHSVYGYWDHDFSSAGNANFTQLVAQNS
ncbi:iron reductase domain protein [Xylariaceae sp. FL0255]|nr:iron reductase domain protein [Xylariaceae sp. FL0255]